jgi:hypothetical protein
MAWRSELWGNESEMADPESGVRNGASNGLSANRERVEGRGWKTADGRGGGASKEAKEQELHRL